MGRSRRQKAFPEAPRSFTGSASGSVPENRIVAQFSWRAPASRFPVSGEGSREEVARRIEKDARKVLLRSPGLEALSEHYKIPEASCFWLGGAPIAPKVIQPDVPGVNRYLIDVRVEGNLFRKLTPLDLASWRQTDVWDEICERSDLLGHPERFDIRVEPL